MSMSTSITGVRDLDGLFKKMMRVKITCEEANITYPPEVTEYFKNPQESPEYLQREMTSVDIKDCIVVSSKSGVDGWEVDLQSLPKEVIAIRFENSY